MNLTPQAKAAVDVLKEEASKLGMELFSQEITAAGGAVLIFNFMRSRRIFKISPEGERV